MTLGVVAAPTSGLVTLDNTKAWLSVVGAGEDDLIGTLIGASSAYLDGPDGILHRLIREWELSYSFGVFPGGSGVIGAPLSPVRSVESFVYHTPAGVETDLKDTAGSFETFHLHGLSYIRPGDDGWPDTDPDEEITITYKGYEGTADGAGVVTVDVPKEIEVACLMLISDMFDNRHTSVRGGMVENPAFRRLLASHSFGIG